MALVEIQPSAHGRAGRGTKKVASLAPHGGSRLAAPAARGIFHAVARAVEKSVWASVALRALGVLAGMLALAAVGASSIARGSGVRVPEPVRSAPSIVAAGVTPFAEAPDAGSPLPVDAGTGADAGGAPALTPDGKVILNRAGVDELRRIPGVGAKRAQAIVELRARLGGRFKRLSDLLHVKGIGSRSLKKMEAYVVLDEPKS